jgi:glucose-6-phosphate isomerase
MPVVLALVSIWYNNFGAESEALIPIRNIFKTGSLFTREQWKVMVKVWVETGNLLTTRLELLFGRTGTNAQHAFFN